MMRMLQEMEEKREMKVILNKNMLKKYMSQNRGYAHQEPIKK
jgi:hypothetical protein